jgi:hypothetical protein
MRDCLRAGQYLAVLTALGLPCWAERPANAQPAPPAPARARANTPALGGSARPARQERDEKRFVPIAGLLIHPYATDDTFGAGLQVGVRRGFASLLFRENFSRSTQRTEDGSLLRLKSRVSFEVSLEAQATLLRWTPYAGLGALVRRDLWEWTHLENQRFVSRGEREITARPLLVAGLVGSVLEANAMLVLQEEPELRFGLGFVVGR